jgi:hypothetical protein
MRFPSIRAVDEERGGRTASHDGVDVGVAPHIEDTGDAGPGGGCQDRDGAKERIDVARRNDHSNERSEDGNRQHAWFRQYDEIRQARCQPRMQEGYGNRCGRHRQYLSGQQSLIFTGEPHAWPPLR